MRDLIFDVIVTLLEVATSKIGVHYTQNVKKLSLIHI